MKCFLCNKFIEVDKSKGLSYYLGQFAYHIHETHGMTLPTIIKTVKEALK